MNQEQFEKVGTANGFIAALDQSGGSTPKALRLYGVPDDAYSTDEEMFALMHEMRARIIASPSFSGDRILAAIVFEDTMDRQIEGVDSISYLWDKKRIVPFLKVDKGLAEESEGVQLMKPISGLDALLEKARHKGVFGTKMRSFGLGANPSGIQKLIDQQFEVAAQIRAAGLVPIIEPEIDIHSPEKAAAEGLLKSAVQAHLDTLSADEVVILKLTLPDVDDFYLDFINNPKVLRVVALSGGYSREEANARLARNRGVIASFSRALTEGLTAQLSDTEFDGILGSAIASIYEASTVKVP